MKNPTTDSIASLSEFLAFHNVPGIEDIDTRAITRRVREHGCDFVFGPIEDEDSLKEHLDQLTSPELEDLVDLVSINEPVIVNEGAVDGSGKPLPRIAAIDCGIKYNILRSSAANLKLYGVHQHFFAEAKSYES